jgi:tetratricopeptide (TPR) repeat protein
MSPEPHNSVEVFYSYAHEDEELRKELDKHLSNLRRQGVISGWHDRNISAGTEWNEAIEQHLSSAKVILLLISPDFMNSDYINDVEVKRAMERHEAGEARVIPVILRPVDWEGAPFSRLEGLPTDLEPVTSWDDSDEAFLDITKGIRKAVKELSDPLVGVPTVPEIPRPPKVGFVSRRDRDGRDIVERLREELAPQKSQLVALWGGGGVGKTTLAAEAVESLAEIHNQRVIWVTADARPNFAFSTLLDDIAEQMGRIDLRPLAVGLKVDSLRHLIAEKPTLIVLDNLETIASEEETLCQDFLAKRVHCPALITTRERIDDALLIPIAAMSAGEAREFLNRLIRQSPDPEIYEVIDRDRILQTAEFNPLIIEWIVAQIDLAQDPDDVLDDLSHGEGDAAQRVFDRSFNLQQMADGGRALLLALSVFTPSATRSAVAKVAGMDRNKKRLRAAQQTLGSLWLVKQTLGGHRLAVEGLTRELTKAKLDKDLRSKTYRQRFVSRFLAYANANRGSTTSDFNAMEAEKENLVRAIQVAKELHDWRVLSELTLLVAGPVDGMLGVRGYWEDVAQLNSSALEIARDLNFKNYVAVFAHNLAVMHESRGEIGEAKELFAESLSISDQLGDQENKAISLHQLGVNAQLLGDFDEARALYEQSLAIKRRLGRLDILASTLRNLGVLCYEQGDWPMAQSYFEDSLDVANKCDNPRNVAHGLSSLALLTMDRGDLVGAKRLFEESFELRKRVGDQNGLSVSLHDLGRLAASLGDLDKARRFLNEGLEIDRRLGNKSGIAASLHELGRLKISEGNRDRAERDLKESLGILKMLGAKKEIADVLKSLGSLRMAEGDFSEAKKLLDESLQTCELLNYKRGIAEVKHSLGLLAENENDRPKAMQLLQESLQTFNELGSHGAEAVRHDLERLQVSP